MRYLHSTLSPMSGVHLTYQETPFRFVTKGARSSRKTPLLQGFFSPLTKGGWGDREGGYEDL
jgi:hypothetical protein